MAPPALNRQRLEELKSIGVDMIGVGLDAVTEELFAGHPHRRPGRRPEVAEVLGTLAGAREIFGPGKVNAHVVVGLGETDADLLALFVALRDRQILAYLFCFNPEPGTRMAGQPETLATALAPGAAGPAAHRDRWLRPGPVRL